MSDECPASAIEPAMRGIMDVMSKMPPEGAYVAYDTSGKAVLAPVTASDLGRTITIPGLNQQEDTMGKVSIEAVLNGWIVKVGCQRVVFTDIEILMGELRSYFADPRGTEKRYLSEGVNAKLVAGCPADEPDLRNDTFATP